MVGKWLGKNSTNWLNTSASSGSQSLGCMWTLLTDARVVELAFLWAAGGPRPQCLFVHLLPVCPAFSILNSRSFQSRLTSVFWWTWLWGRPPVCLWCWVWMVSVFGLWHLIAFSHHCPLEVYIVAHLAQVGRIALSWAISPLPELSCLCCPILMYLIAHLLGIPLGLSSKNAIWPLRGSSQ